MTAGRAALSRLSAVVRLLLALAIGLPILAAAAALALAWRLSQGPLDLPWAARRLEAAANAGPARAKLAIGGIALEWGAFAGGSARGMELALRDLRLVDGPDTLAALSRLDASLSGAGLLRGQIVPRALAASGVELHVARALDGSLSLDLGGIELFDRPAAAPPAEDDPTLAETMAELARPPRLEDTAASPAIRHLQLLRSVRLNDATVLVQDEPLAAAWRVELRSLDLARLPQGGVRGTAEGRIGLGAAVAAIAARADLAPDGGTELQATLAPLAAAQLQQAANAQPGLDLNLGPQDLLEAAVQGTAGLHLDRALHPVRGALHAEAGSGRMRVAGAVIGFDRLSVDADAAWTRPGWTLPQSVAVSRAQAVLHAPNNAWPTTLGATAALTRAEDRIRGTVSATLDHVAFADLPALWPARLGGHVRPWMAANLTGGTARDGVLNAEFEAGRHGADPRLTRVDGSLAGEDATIWWLRPVPPIERAQALLTIKDPQSLDIAVASARQGPLALKDGAIRITGLDVKDQFMTVGADVSGAVPDVIGLLRHPRIRLLDRKPVTMRNPAGTLAGRLSVFLPLNSDLSFDDVKISAKARATDLRLGGLVAGRDLERGDLRLDLTPEALNVAGKAAISGIPADLSVTLDFRDGGPGQVVTRAQATGAATPRQLAAANLDTGGIVDGGAAQFTATYAQRRDGGADVTLASDLRDASLSLVGWRKPAGQPAEAAAKLLLRNDKLLGIEGLHAAGSGLGIEGRVRLVGDRPLLIELDRATLGATQASGQVQLPGAPGEPIQARLRGAVLDLSAQLAASPRPPEPGPPWTAEIAFDRVLLAGQQGLSGVTARAEHDGRRLTRLEAASAAPEAVQATIRPDPRGRRLHVTAQDAGAVLRAFDVTGRVVGGALTLDAAYDDAAAQPPLAGTAQLSGFSVRDAPALGKLLQAVTVYGVVEALSGPGLSFSQATLPFRYDGATLDLTDAEAFSASLGLTAKGRFDLRRQLVDIAGTVVPAYAINAALGRIPILGRLFRAEQGGGLVAVNYAIRGPLANPAVSVNPLSALTPGFLRGLFRIFD